MYNQLAICVRQFNSQVSLVKLLKGIALLRVLEMQVVLCDVIKHVHIDNLDPAATHPVHAISLVPLRREENGRIGMPLKVRFI